MPTTDGTTAQPDAPGGSAGGRLPWTRPERTRRSRLLTLLTGLTAGVLLLDQVTKVWAVASLEPGERVALLGDLFGLQLVRNPGAALSIATGMTWVLTLVAVVVVVVVVRASRRIGSTGWAVALGLLLGGALGNLVDRMVREPGPARGHVIDFLAYGDLFVGNVADIAIVAAALLVVLLTARGVHLDGTRDGDSPTGDAADGATADADAADGGRAPAEGVTDVPAGRDGDARGAAPAGPAAPTQRDGGTA
ncbi:signal peptidase II [Cellulomonas sp. 179-A 9B4 NHS]|uniref:signal peptidase II n=1 Tax=Cellulomonas sp. 179-A 9B4 NHS TaxID=3142379 RepID=UPI0039A03E1E